MPGWHASDVMPSLTIDMHGSFSFFFCLKRHVGLLRTDILVDIEIINYIIKSRNT
jgi:hypothetical protein